MPAAPHFAAHRGYKFTAARGTLDGRTDAARQAIARAFITTRNLFAIGHGLYLPPLRACLTHTRVARKARTFPCARCSRAATEQTKSRAGHQAAANRARDNIALSSASYFCCRCSAIRDLCALRRAHTAYPPPASQARMTDWPNLTTAATRFRR